MSPGRENMMSSIRSPFPCIFCPCVVYCGCGSQRTILVLSNQVEITAKSPGRERWNPIWTFGHQFFRSTVNICLKYYVSRPGETCRCPNALLRIFSITDFDTLKNSWETRETPFAFGETDFVAVGLWLAAQVTQTIVPQVGFWCFCSP